MHEPSREALAIQAAHDNYKRFEGTPNEQTALAELEATVRRIKQSQCCGARCWHCTEWRTK